MEDTDLNTVTVSCSVDGVKQLYFTDPCPLESGDFALDAKYQSSFHITSYITTCDKVPVPDVPSSSLADGLTSAAQHCPILGFEGPCLRQLGRSSLQWRM